MFNNQVSQAFGRPGKKSGNILNDAKSKILTVQLYTVQSLPTP